jgi:hypothetical protein
MLATCREPEPRDNPGLLLGLALGSLAKAGRDKLTLFADDAISGFGAWAEQLIAESTGKHGTGIVPVDQEPLRSPDDYGSDRVFVDLSLVDGSDDDAGRRELVARLERSGHPVIRLELDDPIDLAGEFVRWEVATAFAGAVLGIDPFDQPNVEEAKERTRRVLAGASDDPDPGDDGGIFIGAHDAASLAGLLRPTLGALEVPNYVAIQAFVAPSPDTDAAIARLRGAHSTGQLHKGGPPTGVFVQLTSDHGDDRQIPGWPYSFGQLIDAQARGDREALRAHDRPVLHVHLGQDLEADLATLEQAITLALGDGAARSAAT